jgi:hypothetical protein
MNVVKYSLQLSKCQSVSIFGSAADIEANSCLNNQILIDNLETFLIKRLINLEIENVIWLVL